MERKNQPEKRTDKVQVSGKGILTRLMLPTSKIWIISSPPSNTDESIIYQYEYDASLVTRIVRDPLEQITRVGFKNRHFQEIKGSLDGLFVEHIVKRRANRRFYQLPLIPFSKVLSDDVLKSTTQNFKKPKLSDRLLDLN